MGGIGRVTLRQQTGRPVRLSADGYPEWMPIGVTVDWSKVTAVSSDTTLDDGTVVYDGEKYLEVGTVLVKITKAEIQTVDLSGDDDPTGGTWDMTILGESIAGIAWNVSAADLQTAIRAIDADRADEVTVSKSGFVYTITFPEQSGNVDAITADASDLTGAGGDTFAITIATGTGGDAGGGKYAPYDSGASNGQQTLTRGEVGLVDYTIKDSEVTVMGANVNNETIGLITGGLVWKERLKVGSGTQPSRSALLAALPRLEITPDE